MQDRATPATTATSAGTVRADGRGPFDGRDPVGTEQAADAPAATRVLIALLWVCHFMLWTFGDMFALLQGEAERVEQLPVQLVAATTAVVLVGVVVHTLTGSLRSARRTSLVVAPVYLALDVGFLLEATQPWEFHLGVAYVASCGLIVRHALRWSGR